MKITLEDGTWKIADERKEIQFTASGFPTVDDLKNKYLQVIEQDFDKEINSILEKDSKSGN